ncbi:hypothetical protein AA313_de0201467 [Arthrobotrys entomopaga]|nr:hypothetical protein AA313_de0201467 [Arthrobotrys entomopaga]
MASSELVIREDTPHNDVFHILRAKFGLPLQPEKIENADPDTASYIKHCKYLHMYGKRYLLAAIKEFESFINLDNFEEEVLSKSDSVQSIRRRQERIQKRRVKAFNEELRKQRTFLLRDGGSIITQGNSRGSIASQVPRSRPVTAQHSARSTKQSDIEIQQRILEWQDRNREATGSMYTRSRESMGESDEEINDAFPDYEEEPTDIDIEVGGTDALAAREAADRVGVSPTANRTIKTSIALLASPPPLHPHPSSLPPEDPIYSPPSCRVPTNNPNWGIYNPPDVGPARVYTANKPLFSSASKSFPGPSAFDSKSLPPPSTAKSFPAVATSKSFSGAVSSSQTKMDNGRKRKEPAKVVPQGDKPTSDRPAKRLSPQRELTAPANITSVGPSPSTRPSFSAASFFPAQQNPISRLQENQKSYMRSMGEGTSFASTNPRESSQSVGGTQPTSFNSTMDGKLREPTLESPDRYDDVEIADFPPPESTRGRNQFGSLRSMRAGSQASGVSMASRSVMRHNSPPSEQLLRESDGQWSVGDSTLDDMMQMGQDAPSEPSTGSRHISHRSNAQSVPPMPSAFVTPSPDKRGPMTRQLSGPGGSSKFRFYNTLDGEPFPGDIHDMLSAKGVPFWLQYEITRIVLDSKKGWSDDMVTDMVDTLLENLNGSSTLKPSLVQDELKKLSGLLKPEQAHSTEKMHDDVLAAILKSSTKWDDRLQLSAELIFSKDCVSNSNRRPTIRLRTIHRQAASNRFSREFGSHRFLILRYPKFGSELKIKEADYQRTIEGLLLETGFKLLGRRWSVMYYREAKSNSKSDAKTGKKTLIMFAEDGPGLENITVEKAITWFIPTLPNMKMTEGKCWSRISLGFSKTTATVSFPRENIFDSPEVLKTSTLISKPFSMKDIKAGENSLTDGCGLVSAAVLREIKRYFCLDYVPSAFQGRIGPAKGMWYWDGRCPDSDELWIQIRPDQKKFSGIDYTIEAHRTLEVCSFSKPLLSKTLNLEFIPILLSNGVPEEVLVDLLKEDIQREVGDLFEGKRLEDPVYLRGYLEKKGARSRKRDDSGMKGKMPKKIDERCIMLFNSGFDLNNSVCKRYFGISLTGHCEQIKKKLHINVLQSCYPFCLADPSGKLKKGEVFLKFGNKSEFIDIKTEFRIDVLKGDVLVGRNPAHLKSDIQKVTAVDIPELHHLTDVIIFAADPDSCDRSLADCLSGGDYDGDRVWTCWDTRVVEPFINHEYVPLDVKQYIDEESTKMHEHFTQQGLLKGTFKEFITARLKISLEDSSLGFCTSLWERLTYHRSKRFGDSLGYPQARILATLCGKLVDAPKHGYRLRDDPWNTLIAPYKGLPKPFYKIAKPSGQESTDAKGSPHPIDKLRFQVAAEEISTLLDRFTKQFPSAKPKDSDIQNYYEDTRRYFEAIKKESQQRGVIDLNREGRMATAVLEQMVNLRLDLDALFMKWKNLFPAGSFDDPEDEEKEYIKNDNRVEECMEIYDNILPRTNQGDSSNSGISGFWAFTAGKRMSDWSRLKAAAMHDQVYGRYDKTTPFPWLMAGDVCCSIKAEAVSMRMGNRPVHFLTENMAAATKIRASAMVLPEDSWSDDSSDESGDEMLADD